MAAITRGLGEKREQMVAMVANTFPPISQEWQGHAQLLIHGPADLWQVCRAFSGVHFSYGSSGLRVLWRVLHPIRFGRKGARTVKGRDSG